MKELRNSVCIVGADESDELGTLPHKSMLVAAPRGGAQCRARRRPQDRRRGRRLHRGPALARDDRRGARHRPALRRRHHGGRLLVHHHGRPRDGRAPPRALRRRRRLPRRVGPLRRGRDPPPGHRAARPVRDALRLRRRADLLRHDHHAPHARIRDDPRAVGAGRRLHARVGRAQPEGAQPRADHRRRRAQLAPGLLPVQPAQHLPRDGRRRSGGVDARRPREGLREEAGLRARRGRGDRARDADPDEEPDPERGHAPVRRQGVRDGRRRPQGLRPHHALRRLHLGAADHARVARLLQARRGRALLRERQAPRRAARCRSIPMAAASRTRTPACTASSRSSRRCASSAASAARARCRAPSSRS